MKAFALMRLSSNTHAVNNEQRRVPLSFHDRYGRRIHPEDSRRSWRVVIPGYYMLFAMSTNGVPKRVTHVAPPLMSDVDNLAPRAARWTVCLALLGAALFAHAEERCKPDDIGCAIFTGQRPAAAHLRDDNQALPEWTDAMHQLPHADGAGAQLCAAA